MIILTDFTLGDLFGDKQTSKSHETLMPHSKKFLILLVFWKTSVYFKKPHWFFAENFGILWSMWYFAWKLVLLLGNLIFNKTDLIKTIHINYHFRQIMINVHQISIPTNYLGIFIKYLPQINYNTIEILTPVISKKSYEYQKISFLVSQKLICLQLIRMPNMLVWYLWWPL